MYTGYLLEIHDITCGEKNIVDGEYMSRAELKLLLIQYLNNNIWEYIDKQFSPIILSLWI